MPNHRQCRLFTPAYRVDHQTENTDFLGECEIPCIKFDTHGVAHVVWPAIMGDETACADFEEMP